MIVVAESPRVPLVLAEVISVILLELVRVTELPPILDTIASVTRCASFLFLAFLFLTIIFLAGGRVIGINSLNFNKNVLVKLARGGGGRGVAVTVASVDICLGSDWGSSWPQPYVSNCRSI